MFGFSNLSPWHGMSLHVQRLIRTSDVLQQRNDSIGKGRRYGDNAGMFRRRVLIHVYVLPLGSVLERHLVRADLKQSEPSLYDGKAKPSLLQSLDDGTKTAGQIR